MKTSELRQMIREEIASLSEGSQDVKKAQAKIEVILNALWDSTESNDDLIKLLNQLTKDVKRGFIGEPT